MEYLSRLNKTVNKLQDETNDLIKLLQPSEHGCPGIADEYALTLALQLHHKIEKRMGYLKGPCLHKPYGQKTPRVCCYCPLNKMGLCHGAEAIVARRHFLKHILKYLYGLISWDPYNITIHDIWKENEKLKDLISKYLARRNAYYESDYIKSPLPLAPNLIPVLQSLSRKLSDFSSRGLKPELSKKPD